MRARAQDDRDAVAEATAGITVSDVTFPQLTITAPQDGLVVYQVSENRFSSS